MEPHPGGAIRALSPAEAIRLHDQVFGRDATYSDPRVWAKYTVVVGNAAGFVAGYVKAGRPHLSLAAVAEEARGQGLYSRLAREFASRMQAKAFTISTYPARFPAMAAWIGRHLDPDAPPPAEAAGKLTATVAP